MSPIATSFVKAILGTIGAVLVLGIVIVLSMTLSSSTTDRAGKAPVPTPNTSLTSADEAQQWLRDWADALPKDSPNYGARSKIVSVVDPNNTTHWSVRVELGTDTIPIFGFLGASWPSLDSVTPSKDFLCLALTSATATPFTYPLERTSITSGNYECDTSDPRLREVNVITPAQRELDWTQLTTALADPPARDNPYLFINEYDIGLAKYRVLDTTAVSATETRFIVEQTPRSPQTLSCEAMDLDERQCRSEEPDPTTRTILVSPTKTTLLP